MVWVAAVGVAMTAAVVMGLLVPRVRIVDDEEAPDFGALVSRRSVVGVALAAFVVAQVLWLVPEPHWWLWVPYLGI
uniref:hypothetical protein n=1 Tax=Tessaracoccus lapidicaptus TaxID=1427523 RepID=UPI003340013F